MILSLSRLRRTRGALSTVLAVAGAFALTGCGGGGGGPSGGNNTTNVGSDTFVFVSTRDGNPEIYRATLGGTNQIRLTNNPAADNNPFVARNGQFMVFSSQRDGNAEIYRYNFANAALQRLTEDEVGTNVSDDLPVISPNSNRIAWVSERGGVPNVWIMSDTGANQVGITSTGGDTPTYTAGTSPTFSPDSTQIAYLNAGLDIVVRTLTTGAERVIDTGLSAPATISDLTWSPNGNSFAYTTSATAGGASSIQVIPASGTTTAGAVTFAPIPGSKTSLTWGPTSTQQPLLFSAVSDAGTGKTDLFSAITPGATAANQVTTLGSNTAVSWTN